jgi:hypothetical protein
MDNPERGRDSSTGVRRVGELMGEEAEERQGDKEKGRQVEKNPKLGRDSLYQD